MNDIQRIRHNGIYIQCKRTKFGDYSAWSSKEPSQDAIRAPGDVYFDFGKTPQEAIEKVKGELNSLQCKRISKKRIAGIALIVIPLLSIPVAVIVIDGLKGISILAAAVVFGAIIALGKYLAEQ